MPYTNIPKSLALLKAAPIKAPLLLAIAANAFTVSAQGATIFLQQEVAVGVDDIITTKIYTSAVEYE